MLTSIPNPVGASKHAEQIGELAATFISQTNVMIAELISEAESLRIAAVTDETSERIQAIANDLAFLNVLVSASAKSLASAWSDITSARSALIAHAR